MAVGETLRWGVIGLGWFGEIHAETISQMPGIELAAVCTRRSNRLADVADRFGVKRRYTDYRQMLDDPHVDAVSVVTHVHDHCQIAVDALRAGKHVLLEKPMAPDVSQCETILEAASQARSLFMVGHICRFDPRVTLAKEAIDEGRVGRVISMHARRNLSKWIGRQVLDKISALEGDGIHDADLMLWFTGAKPVNVYAQEIHPGTNKFPDGGWAMFRLDNGAIGVVESIWHLPESTPYQIDARMEIIGTEGAIYIDCGNAGVEIHDAQGPKQPDALYWPRVFGNRFGILRAELRYFADCVLAGRAPDRITPRESRDAVALMAAATRSATTGQIVTL